MTTSPGRIWEIDFLRGIAILLMTVFHLVFDLVEYKGFNLSYLDGFWYYEGRLSAIAFMIIAGVSATLSGRHLRRGLIVLGCGLVITLVTYVFDPRTYIRFGILHMLGSCMLLYPLVQRLQSGWLVTAGSLAIIAGLWTRRLSVSSSLLLPLGIMPLDFISVDYYPLLPWSGLFLYGAALGRTFYRQKRSLLPYFSFLQPLIVLGRHSLVYYLLHQPALLAILSIVA
jgi:uncharacterized membrane protein